MAVWPFAASSVVQVGLVIWRMKVWSASAQNWISEAWSWNGGLRWNEIFFPVLVNVVYRPFLKFCADLLRIKKGTSILSNCCIHWALLRARRTLDEGYLLWQMPMCSPEVLMEKFVAILNLDDGTLLTSNRTSLLWDMILSICLGEHPNWQAWNALLLYFGAQEMGTHRHRWGELR